MTVAEWLAGVEPALTDALRLRNESARRKIRLLLCAACRGSEGIRPEIDDPIGRRSVEIAEQFADDGNVLEELRVASAAAGEWLRAVTARWYEAMEDPTAYWPTTVRHLWARLAFAASQLPDDLFRTGEYDADDGVWCALYDAGCALNGETASERHPSDCPELASLIRDIFASHARVAEFDPVWRTDTAVALARRMYELRDFSAMPILADALQDAGCNSEDILNHCRGDGPHARGCWVVDLVLGKE